MQPSGQINPQFSRARNLVCFILATSWRGLGGRVGFCSPYEMAGDTPEGGAGFPAGPLVFIKLGGSLVSDKTKPETLREDVLDRIARCIHQRYSYLKLAPATE